jgi:hypothetical protein
MAPDCYSPIHHASCVTKIAFHATAKEITTPNFKKTGAQVGTMVLPPAAVIPCSRTGTAGHEGQSPIDPLREKKVKRPSPLTLRITSSQRAAIRARAARAGCSVNRYVLLQACGRELVPNHLSPEDRAERAALLRCYRGTGNLLNQIARQLNSGRIVGALDIVSVMKRHEENANRVMQAFVKDAPQ